MQRIAIATSQLQGKQILLTIEQYHYLNRVLRLKEGDRFIAMDGLGTWWLAALEEAQTAQIVEQIAVQTELPVTITLMAALPKGNGFDDVVRYCTELGVSTIVPIISDRTLLNPSPQKLERWQRIALEAAEQSERAIVPTITPPVTFTKSISTVTATYRYICVARGANMHLKKAIDSVPLVSEIVIAIGPEGGWTTTEIEKATSTNFQTVSLGKRILRAVTAPIVALSVIAATFEESTPRMS
ncbi:16S rRNA (uracil(1498)-N(3))-methyltransferase [Aliterella atlantica]|uniref:Ribosomal RNA small subunit methyltransferase E n=1 Tax=Aliterella atlantica CENA595 TaxID=1618023 RepID=A0A0D8ZS55_9CYAN|nr:16S rRNA (uracil(1498)-N(3))-methyltransferase [Aliterella atlantica]KJH71319.1 16S rRNA methyltransferase [Aliterella atlantica CENA595]